MNSPRIEDRIIRSGFANNASLRCSIKANYLCSTMVNLPCLQKSCFNFPVPTGTFIVCELNFSMGSSLTERTTGQLQLLFLNQIFTKQPCLPDTRFSGRNIISGFIANAASYSSIVLGLFLESCPISEFQELDRILDFFYLLCCHCHNLFLRALDISQHFLRIIQTSIL